MRGRRRKESGIVVRKLAALIGLAGLFLATLGLVCLAIWSNWGSVWDEDRFYVMAVVQDDWVRVIGVGKDEKRAVELVIPGAALVPVVGTQGELRASALWRFGENEKRASELVRLSLESWLGVNIDAVIKVGGNGVDWMDAWNGDDGVLADRLRVVKVWGELREDQKRSARIPENLTSVERSPDGESELVVDGLGLRAWTEDLWTNTEVLDEKLSIEVVNVSGEPGVGRLMEHILKAGGGLVVSVRSGEHEEGDCWFKGDAGERYQETIDWLKRQVGCKWQGKEGVPDGVIQLYVGNGWAKRYR